MKKNEELLDAIGKIDEKLIPDLSPRKKNHKVLFISSVAVVVAAAVLLLALFPPIFVSNLFGESHATAKVLAAPNYPEMAEYPDENALSFSEFDKQYKLWHETREVLLQQPTGYQTAYFEYFKEVVSAMSNPDSKENFVFSPLSLYLALGMTAEISDGQSRQQILDVLHEEDIESLRNNSKSLFEVTYADDGMATCILADSLWTNNKCKYDSKVLETLAAYYYASAFTGDPASAKYTEMYRSWINEQTDGLLSDYVQDMKLDPQTVLALVSTVNYSAKWNFPFDEQATKPATFHAPDKDLTCDFMKAENQTIFYRGESFDSISLDTNGNGYMRLILPNEGTSPEALLSDEECLGFMLNKNNVAKKDMLVTLSLPKFDISNSLDLNGKLKKMGITDIFNSSSADFSTLGTGEDNLFISQAIQNVRVTIDEEGCKAAAVTAMMLAGAAMPPDDRIELVFDRPFIFEIVSPTGVPLFIGIVNQPVA